MKKLLFILGLIVAVVFAYYGVKTNSSKIQSDIETRLAQTFTSESISPNIVTSVSGRDVTLSGAVSDAEIKARAGQIAKALNGVRSVDNQITVVEPPAFEMPVMSEPPVDAPIDPSLDLKDDLEMGSDELPPATEEAVTEPQDIFSPETEVQDEVKNVETKVEVETPVEIKTAPPAQVNLEPQLKTEPVEEPIVDECQSELAGMLEKEMVSFDTGKATIKSSSHTLLNGIATATKNCKESVITILGYTDNSGDSQANVSLSLARAKAVGKYLISKGVRQEIRVVGNGPNDPISDNETEEGRAKNRRIEFKVTKVKN